MAATPDKQARQRSLQCALGKPAIACEDCGLYHLCLQDAQGRMEGRRIRPPHLETLHAPRGDFLVTAGAPFRYVYAVRTGAMEICLPHEDGPVDVLGFAFPGERLGMEALGLGYYPYAIRALEHTILCAFDLRSLAQGRSGSRRLYAALLRLMSEDFQRLQSSYIALRGLQVMARLSTILLDFAGRIGKVKDTSSQLNLPMTRTELANFLGMAPETLCRALQQLENDRIIRVHGRRIRILDQRRLERLVPRQP